MSPGKGVIFKMKISLPSSIFSRRYVGSLSQSSIFFLRAVFFGVVVFVYSLTNSLKGAFSRKISFPLMMLALVLAFLYLPAE